MGNKKGYRGVQNNGGGISRGVKPRTINKTQKMEKAPQNILNDPRNSWQLKKQKQEKIPQNNGGGGQSIKMGTGCAPHSVGS